MTQYKIAHNFLSYLSVKVTHLAKMENLIIVVEARDIRRLLRDSDQRFLCNQWNLRSFQFRTSRLPTFLWISGDKKIFYGLWSLVFQNILSLAILYVKITREPNGTELDLIALEPSFAMP